MIKLRSHSVDRSTVSPKSKKELKGLTVSCVKDGRVVKVEVEDTNKDLDYQDFSIKSLLDAGATDLLKNQVKLSSSVLSVSDSVGQIDSMLGDVDINSLNKKEDK